MSDSLTIRNQKYYREFDNSDNPCCWQVGLIGQDVEEILDQNGIQFEEMYEDWGVSYWWKNAEEIEHSITISCIDVAEAIYDFDYFAIRRRWRIFSRMVPDIDSDFARLLPLFQALGN